MKIDENMTYEQATARLDEIVRSLEKNDIPLEEALALFEEGTALTAFCMQKLETAKQKITELDSNE